MYNPILSIFSLCNYEREILKNPTDEQEAKLIKEITKNVKKSLYQIVISIILICAAYVVAKVVFWKCSKGSQNLTTFFIYKSFYWIKHK